MIEINETFPEFSLNAVMDDGSLASVNHTDIQNEWSVIYFYPKDFTFICPTEIADMDKLLPEANVLGISGDNEYCKQAWRQSNELIKDISHPLGADCGLKLATACGVVDENEGVCLRATFIVDPKGVIQHVSVNALDTGRNVDEILRTLQALKAGGLTACSWKPGEDLL